MSETLQEVVGKAVKAIHDSEKFAVPVLAVKAEKAAQAYPHDAPLVTASNVLKKMASDNQMFISRADLNKLYDQLYSRNSKLKDVFSEELDRTEMERPTTFKRSESEERPLETDYSKVADPVLANALNAALGDGEELKLYSSDIAKRAEKVCMAELEAQGLPPRKVSVFAGQKDMLVCQATYDTPKGESHMLVPVEVKDDMALLPTMFLTRAGFADIDKDKIKQHIYDTAGKSFKVDGQQLLNLLSTAKNGISETADDIDFAVMKLKSSKETPATHTINGIVYQQMENPSVVSDPDVPKDPEVESFAQRLSTPAGIAKQVFGETVVNAGAHMLTRKLSSFGYSKPQVSVAEVSDDESTIYYAVKPDHSTAFKVPVKIKNGFVFPPSIATAGGKVSEFSQNGISELIQAGQTESKLLAVASPLYGSKPSELLQQVRDAINEGNIPKAEDAIDVLAETDEKGYKTAVALLLSSFSADGIEKSASEEKGCSMIVKNSTTKHPVCGHLNLPLHKVYQDKHGDCHPLYRKNMDDTNEGGTFLSQRIIFQG